MGGGPAAVYGGDAVRAYDQFSGATKAQVRRSPTTRNPIGRRSLRQAPRHLFFTGKGGVGKTSLACASAVLLGDAGRRVLIVSTDPASNLDAVLDTQLSLRPIAVTGVSGVDAMNINPEQAALRLPRAHRSTLSRRACRNRKCALLQERLSGACTVEVAAFDEFALLLERSQEDASPTIM